MAASLNLIIILQQWKAKMAQPSYIQKTLVMKPEVTKIFDDLDRWLDHCRMEMINFDPKDLYRSREYKEWARSHDKKYKKNYNQ